jgi:prevent-host-death family protein
MNHAFDVAEAKARFSELLNRASFSHERFLIRKRGKAVAAIVSTEDLARLENEVAPRRGLMAAVGILADIPDWDNAVRQVMEDRRSRADRDVDVE